MGGLIVLAVIGFVIYSMAKSGSASPNSSNYKYQPSDSRVPSAPKNVVTTNKKPDFEVSKIGFQPTDRCTCGGTWIKRTNSATGGVFFSCSNYPRCKKSRDEVLKQQLGDKYFDFYCSRGHSLEKHGTIASPSSARGICKRCIVLGYVRPSK